MPDLPILYSFRRCPYAIRARMAIAYAGVEVELREILLKDKPQSMLDASAKGTVPVLVLANGEVLDESMDVMTWALAHSDDDHWAPGESCAELTALIDNNDGPFKHWLDRYKYADRFPEHPASWYRQNAKTFLQKLEQRLGEGEYLLGDRLGLADVAIFPFVRQFSMVEGEWFKHCDLTRLRRWLSGLIASALFQSVMDKHRPWQPGQPQILFPGPGHTASLTQGTAIDDSSVNRRSS